MTGDREHVYHAVMLDPRTGALLTLEQLRAMVGELIEAEAEWLPAFVHEGCDTQSHLPASGRYNR